MYLFRIGVGIEICHLASEHEMPRYQDMLHHMFIIYFLQIHLAIKKQ